MTTHKQKLSSPPCFYFIFSKRGNQIKDFRGNGQYAECMISYVIDTYLEELAMANAWYYPSGIVLPTKTAAWRWFIEDTSVLCSSNIDFRAGNQLIDYNFKPHLVCCFLFPS